GDGVFFVRTSATQPVLVVHRVARHARTCGRVGAGRRGKALGEAGRSGALRPHSPADESLAHDSRVDRTPYRVGSGYGLRGEFRRHELRLAAGKDDWQTQIRPGVHEYPGRPD